MQERLRERSMSQWAWFDPFSLFSFLAPNISSLSLVPEGDSSSSLPLQARTNPLTNHCFSSEGPNNFWSRLGAAKKRSNMSIWRPDREVITDNLVFTQAIKNIVSLSHYSFYLGTFTTLCRIIFKFHQLLLTRCHYLTILWLTLQSKGMLTVTVIRMYQTSETCDRSNWDIFAPLETSMRHTGLGFVSQQLETAYTVFARCQHRTKSI